MEKVEVTIPDEVTQITNQLIEANYEAYLVGGCVRDLLRDTTPKDWDITTDATPEEMLDVFARAHYDNEYGTVRVVNDNNDEELKTLEITTFRTEDTYSDNRHPDDVVFADNIDADLTRRDFTINALALNLRKVSRDNNLLVSQETLIDNHGGLPDLEQNRLRTVGKAEERFREDPLRIMRGVRFAAELSFRIEPTTKKAMGELSERLNDIAVERIREELEKIVMSDNPKLGLEIAQNIDALKVFLPELADTTGIEQNQAHKFDLWDHLTKALQTAADKGWPKHIRFAALFHDIGKVQTREWDEERGDWTFHNHEMAGSRVTEDIMQRLKFPNKLTNKVVKLVRWHMFYSDTDEITHSAVRRLIRNIGKDNIWDLIKLRRADRLGMGRPKEEPYRLRKYQAMIEEVIRDPVSVKNLAIDGNDVIRETSEKPGPRIGHILHALLDKVLEDPDANDKDTLMGYAKKLSQLSDEELKKFGTQGKKEKKRVEKEAKKEIREKYYVQ